MSDLLCCKTIETCAKLLDADADRQEKVWNEHIANGGKGPATSYHTIPRVYAKNIRDLALVSR